MPSSLSSLINLSNSIIGVSLLTMPYCFQQCGILLSCVVLCCSAFINKYACHMLLKGSMLTRRRKFEYLAYHTLGYNGKLLIELGLICFLLGGCVALFVVAGDLLPAMLGSGVSQENRIYFLVFLGFFVALPLSLRRNTESLTSFSLISMIFYAFLAIKMFFDSLPILLSGYWLDRVIWWKTDNLLAILPIFTMALAGQPQVFEVFDLAGTDVHHLKKCDSTVSSAMHICLSVYIVVGVCGYIGSYDKVGALPGNSLLLLDDSWMSWMFKCGFVASLIMSFPLCLFPCRTSLHSLIYRRGIKLHEVSSSIHDFIPENRFKILTLTLLSSTLGAALVIPRIELFLGLTGATIGCVVCIVAPATIYIGATKKDQTFERVSAQLLILIGFVIMGLCTMSMMNRLNQPGAFKTAEKFPMPVQPKPMDVQLSVPKFADTVIVTGDKRQEPAEPNADIHEIKSLSNKTVQGVKYQITPNEPPKPKFVPKARLPLKAQVTSTKTPQATSKKDKDEMKLLEQIAEVQQEQKKMIEDIQKELKQEIALHKEIKVNQTKDEIDKVQQNIKSIDKQVDQIVKDQAIPVDSKTTDYKRPLKVLSNRKFDKFQSKDNQNIVKGSTVDVGSEKDLRTGQKNNEEMKIKNVPRKEMKLENDLREETNIENDSGKETKNLAGIKDGVKSMNNIIRDISTGQKAFEENVKINAQFDKKVEVDVKAQADHGTKPNEYRKSGTNIAADSGIKNDIDLKQNVKSMPMAKGAIASLANAAEHARKSNDSQRASEKPELLSELTKEDRPALLKNLNNSLKIDKRPIEAEKDRAPNDKKIAVPLVVKMNPANSSRKEPVHKEI